MELVKSNIENKIYLLRDVQVMLDSDLAELYNTETKFINRAAKRNASRFPEEFMFQLTEQEWQNLRFQSGTSRGKLLLVCNCQPIFFMNRNATTINFHLNI
jgi:hypothetical protein